MPIRKRLKLLPTPQGWMLDFCGDSEVYRLFGATILPTPFTAQASTAIVLAEIKRLNPDADVTLA